MSPNLWNIRVFSVDGVALLVFLPSMLMLLLGWIWRILRNVGSVQNEL